MADKCKDKPPEQVKPSHIQTTTKHFICSTTTTLHIYFVHQSTELLTTATMRSALFFILALAMANYVVAKAGGGNRRYPDCGAPFCARGRVVQMRECGAAISAVKDVKVEDVKVEDVKIEDAKIEGDDKGA
ncbi:predicted protein [Plenodomus lingam JN3]|uniref:Uncharacterized protein n=1 Tax=Leptosphaeria maculans (strain JN3 / isolate v23.1.3 / race Av1-4-5-6-7-8) TaxID=985895 RepID=E5A6Z6_LEPMJ|nr:predicted protein [Plenodomus lingam JN3]CBX99391.1 predicted protein [Plenodomus lingam JN3]